MAHRIVVCAGGFGRLQNPMKFLPYFGGSVAGILKLPGDRRPIGDGLTLVTQWRREINSSERGSRLKKGLSYQFARSVPVPA
jgi:hypothetical protein